MLARSPSQCRPVASVSADTVSSGLSRNQQSVSGNSPVLSTEKQFVDISSVLFEMLLMAVDLGPKPHSLSLPLFLLRLPQFIRVYTAVPRCVSSQCDN